MTSARRFCIFGLVLWLLVGALPGFPPGFADEAPPPSPRLGSSDNTPRLFAFAQALLEEGEYYRAIGEFQRFLFFYAEHPLAPQAQLRIGMAFFCGERWLQAFEVFRRVAQAAPDTPIEQAAALWMAETRARGGDHSHAIRLYQEVITQYPGTSAAQRAAYLIGWSLLRKHRWTEAHSAMGAIAEESPYHPSAERLAAALDPSPGLAHRSPTVARALSMVLPGAGQMYTGKPLDGIIGLGVHGALIAGTAGAVLVGLEGAGGIAAFFTWGFYRTQMSNAAVSAREFNIQAEERFIGQLAVQEQPFLAAPPMSIRCTPLPQSGGRWKNP